MAVGLLVGCGGRSLEQEYQASVRELHSGNLNRAVELARKGVGRAGSDRAWAWKFRLVEGEAYLTLRKPEETQNVLGAGDDPPPELRGSYLVLLADAKRRLNLRLEAREFLGLARKIAVDRQDRALALDVKQREFYMAPEEEKVRVLEEVLADARQLGDRRIEAIALIDLGYLRTQISRFDEAMHFLFRAERIAAESGFPRLRGMALGNLGWCQLVLGESDRAIESLRMAERLSRDSGDVIRTAIWVNNIGNWHYRRGEYAESRERFQESAALSREARDPVNLARAIANLSEASTQVEDLSAAEAALRSVQVLVRSLGKTDRSATFSQFLEGRLASKRQEWASAEAAFLETARMARETNHPGLLWTSHRELAKIYAQTGRPALADREYRNTLEIVDREWRALNDDVLRVGFLSSLIELHQSYVEFLVDQGSTERALEVVESSRARVLARKLDQQIAAGGPASPSAARLKALSAATNTYFLSFWTAPKRSFVWLVKPTGIEKFDLPPRDQIAALAARYSSAVTAGQNPIERGNPYGEELFQILLSGVAARIPKGASVIAAADGGLHRLNLETLVVPGAKPRYWIEDVTISVAPSLASLERAALFPVVGRDASLLFIGDPVPPDPSFPALLYLGREREVVESHFAVARRSVYTRANAQPAAYSQSGPQRFTHLHFAAHAVPNDDRPLSSSVVLSGRQDAFRLYAHDVLERPLKASLVVLSACHSAGARSYSGEGLLGFSWAFLSTGARNVIAGLWQVDDEATVELVRRLYDGMASGMNPGAALRSAKLALLSQGNARAPYYWGSFQMFTRDAFPARPPSGQRTAAGITAPQAEAGAALE